MASARPRRRGEKTGKEMTGVEIGGLGWIMIGWRVIGWMVIGWMSWMIGLKTIAAVYPHRSLEERLQNVWRAPLLGGPLRCYC